MKRTISILALGLILTLGVAIPSQAQPAFPFSDGAEDEGISSGFWTPDREDSGWGIRATAARTGDQVWSVTTDANWDWLTLAGTVDLTTASNPMLSFWIRSLDGGLNYSVTVSSDGGETWETPQSSTRVNSAEWTRVQWSLESHRTPNVLVSIGAVQWNAGTTLQVDDILIDDAPALQVIRMTEPTNNGFRLSWNESTADDFRQYRIVIDTDASGVLNDRDTGSLVSTRRERRLIDITDKTTNELALDDLVFINTRYFARLYEQDTQDLWNQGSERAESQTTFRTTPEVGPFVQDFEGSFEWASDLPWAVTEETSGEAGHSGTHVWSDSPIESGSANYAPSSNRWLVAEMDLSGVTRPLLRFNHRYTFEQNSDWGYVALSTDNVNWSNIAAYTGIEGLWKTEEINLSSFGRRSQVFLRFQVTSNGAGVERDGWYIDDVEIVDNSATLAFPFVDDVEDATASDQQWINEGWSVEATAAHSGDQVWSITTDNTWDWLTLAGTVDLTVAANPALSFWARSLDGGLNYWVSVSTDGGATFESLQSSTRINSAEWTRFQWSLENYRTPSVLVKIGAIQWNANAVLQIDDILIDDAPGLQVVRMTEPTNNGFRLSWNESTADDFRQYRIVIDTDASGVLNDRDTGSLVSTRRERRLIDITDKTTNELALDDLVFINTRYFARLYEQDTQDLWNQGSERAESQTTFRTTPEVGPFVQDFEGSFEWASDLPWAVTEETSGEAGHSGTHVWSDSPIESGSANYAPSSNRWLVAEMDLSGVTRPLLRFNHRYTFEQNSDWGYVALSTDNVNWSNIAAYTGIEGLWKTEEINLSSFGRRSQVFLRFQVTSNGAGVERDGWYIDDVEIVDNSATLAFPFVDDVEDATASDQQWINEGWSVEATAAHSGDQVWSITTDNTWDWLTLAGTVDLTVAANPALSFWARSLDGGLNYWVSVSTDGGATFESLQSSTRINSAEWTRFQWSLENYRTPSVLVKIGATQWNANAVLQIDDISIDFPPTQLGDVSGDGEVTAFDAALLLRYLVGLRPLGSSGLAAADVTGNGTISPLDGTLILQFAAGIITVFPAESTGGKVVASSGSLEWAEARSGGESNLMVLPLVLGRDARNVTSVQLNADIDPALVAVEGISSSLPSDWQVAHNVEDGELKLVMAGVTPVEAGELAQLRLRLLQPGARAEVDGRGAVNENPVRELASASLGALPAGFALRQNYPNPFNPTTRIQYQLAESGEVRLTVFNLVGQTVRRLVGERQQAGIHAIEWDGRSDAGEQMESGVYLYRLETPGFSQTRKMVMVQ